MFQSKLQIHLRRFCYFHFLVKLSATLIDRRVSTCKHPAEKLVENGTVRQRQMFHGDNMAAARHASWKTHVRFCVWSINFVALRRTSLSPSLVPLSPSLTKKMFLLPSNNKLSAYSSRTVLQARDSHCTLPARAVWTYRVWTNYRGFLFRQGVKIAATDRAGFSSKATRRKTFITRTPVFIKRSKMQFRCSLWLAKGEGGGVWCSRWNARSQVRARAVVIVEEGGSIIEKSSQPSLPVSSRVGSRTHRCSCCPVPRIIGHYSPA